MPIAASRTAWRSPRSPPDDLTADPHQPPIEGTLMSTPTSGRIAVGPRARPHRGGPDAPDLGTAGHWAAAVSPSVAALKVGLESYLRDGAGGWGRAGRRRGRRRRAPGALPGPEAARHPQHRGGAARSVAPLAPAILTVHALGGPQMIAAAAQQLPQTRIAAVTILTSMDEAALTATGIAGTPIQAVLRLAGWPWRQERGRWCARRWRSPRCAQRSAPTCCSSHLACVRRLPRWATSGASPRQRRPSPRVPTSSSSAAPSQGRPTPS